MNKEIKQTKQAKEEFESVLIPVLLENNYTRKELIDLYNFKDRNLRNEISKISMFYPVISHSKKAGYRICNVEKLLKENNVNNINSEIEEIQCCLGEINSRIKMLKKRQRALIGALKVLEKGKQDNEENI